MVRLGGDFAMLGFVSAPEDRVFELHRVVNDLHYTKFDVLTRLSEVIPFRRPAYSSHLAPKILKISSSPWIKNWI